MKIKTIVIGDNCADLETHIGKIPYLKLMSTFTDPTEALSIIKSGDVELIFIDADNSASINGMDFIKRLHTPPKTVFISSKADKAVEAFDNYAVDFLLKPFSFERFLIAAERASAQIVGKPNKYDFIFVKSEHNVIKLHFKNIYYIEGYKDYLKIYTDQARPILTITTFKAMEELLSTNFLRIHKSYMIAVDKIVSFRNGTVVVKDKHIPIGSHYREIFNKTLIEGRLTY
ncbi:MAG TPA: LytTR family DNA-binding domain-containing protein [Cyclobacteriaceae bacterium]|jgi:DNA-binding LytR/AlgR family response regulator|nr:LytTR family DNA-binding domain-containing protein [Cyclobacteriaceae bacterium]